MHATLPRLESSDFPTIRRKSLETLQVDLGYKCDQSCVHCHVDARPARTEMMDCAAGMPNFQGIRQGLLTRIARDPAPDALYGTWLEGVRVEALRFMREFLANWPLNSPAHASYYRRIVEGPSWRPGDAVRI